MTDFPTALVTGSTSGIGLGIARHLASLGYAILLNGLGDRDEIEALRADIERQFGVAAHYHGADMTRPDEIRELVATAEQRFGRVDVLVNNAGIQFVAPLQDFPAEKWEQVLSINLSASFYTIKAALPGMIARDFGRIVNIASAHGLVASPDKAAYVAAKHGLVGLTKVVALEQAERNITCNAVCPGWVETPLVQKQIERRAAASGNSIEQEAALLVGEKQPNRRFAGIDEVARAVAFLASPDSRAITGTTLSIDGGWTAQ